ncbi:hypothetical protein D6745_04815 [Candidatus Woesearchaeota archaeon]|nr:MAG: hypothetical protein D6745_04815 [Candidatus Woesearchaeota archaeon]
MKKKTISRDTPLLSITLRRYEKPNSLEGRELLRKLCLSLGLLQPGDSRDVIVDVLHVLLLAREKQELISAEEVRRRVTEIRKQQNLPMIGIASPNIRRQLRRLKDSFLIERVVNDYRIAEFSELSEIFEEKIEKFMFPQIVKRVKEYLKAVDERL